MQKGRKVVIPIATNLFQKEGYRRKNDLCYIKDDGGRIVEIEFIPLFKKFRITEWEEYNAGEPQGTVDIPVAVFLAIQTKMQELGWIERKPEETLAAYGLYLYREYEDGDFMYYDNADNDSIYFDVAAKEVVMDEETMPEEILKAVEAIKKELHWI